VGYQGVRAAGANSRGLEDLRRRKRQVFQFSGIQRGVIVVIHGQKRIALVAKQDHVFAAFRRCRLRPFEAERGVGTLGMLPITVHLTPGHSSLYDMDDSRGGRAGGVPPSFPVRPLIDLSAWL
jgi:hypothetical protein